MKRTLSLLKTVLVVVGPAIALALVLYLPRYLGREEQTSRGAVGPDLSFSDVQIETQDTSPSEQLVVVRRVSLSPFAFSALEVVGNDLVAGGKGAIVAINLKSFVKESAKYLVPQHAEYAAASLQAIRSLQREDDDKVWVFDYYGMASLYNTRKTAAPIRVVNAGDGNIGGAFIGNRVVVHRPSANANLVFLELDGQKTKGAALVDGICCTSLDVESTRPVGQGGPPPYGSVNRGMTMWLGRAAFTVADSRVALAFLMDSRVHIYDEQGVLKHSIAGPKAVPLHFRARRGQDDASRIEFGPADETRFAYTGASSNSSAIYALFSGRRFRDNRATALLGSEIHVYSWNGHILGVLKLPEPVLQIAVTADGAIYGVSGSELIEFKPKTPS